MIVFEGIRPKVVDFRNDTFLVHVLVNRYVHSPVHGQRARNLSAIGTCLCTNPDEFLPAVANGIGCLKSGCYKWGLPKTHSA